MLSGVQVDAKILYSSRSGLGHPAYYKSIEFELKAPAWFAISASILQVRPAPPSQAKLAKHPVPSPVTASRDRLASPRVPRRGYSAHGGPDGVQQVLIRRLERRPREALSVRRHDGAPPSPRLAFRDAMPCRAGLAPWWPMPLRVICAERFSPCARCRSRRMSETQKRSVRRASMQCYRVRHAAPCTDHSCAAAHGRCSTAAAVRRRCLRARSALHAE
jgi:hypothetical protein